MAELDGDSGGGIWRQARDIVRAGPVDWVREHIGNHKHVDGGELVHLQSPRRENLEGMPSPPPGTRRTEPDLTGLWNVLAHTWRSNWEFGSALLRLGVSGLGGAELELVYAEASCCEHCHFGVMEAEWKLSSSVL